MMDISPIKPFDPKETDEGWRQICGTWHSDEKYYAALRPKDASGFDGEDILVIRDDAFGPGLVYAALPEQEISAMIDGRDLHDPVDAVLSLNTGRILMLRDGLMRYEVIPGFEIEYPRPASIWALAEIDGQLWAAGSSGYVLRRNGSNEWALETAGLIGGSLGSQVDHFILGSLSGRSEKVVAVGNNDDYRAAALETDGIGEWRPSPLEGSSLSGVSFMNDQFYISARKGKVWVGSPEEGYRSALTAQYDVDFNAIGCWNDQIYVAGSEGPIWRIIDGALEEVTTPGSGYLYARRFEVRSRDCIIDAQNGFAVLQDNGTWRRISVPWGPGTF